MLVSLHTVVLTLKRLQRVEATCATSKAVALAEARDNFTESKSLALISPTTLALMKLSS